MISIPIEIYGCCSHSMPYGTGISDLTSPTEQLSHHKNIGLESPYWDKFPPPVKIQRTCEGRLLLYTSDVHFNFSSHLWQNTWACSFSLRAEKTQSVESKTIFKDSLLGFWFDSAWCILKFNRAVFINLSLKNPLFSLNTFPNRNTFLKSSVC